MGKQSFLWLCMQVNKERTSVCWFSWKRIGINYENTNNKYQLFSKTDFYDGYEGTETIEQTSEEMSYSSFPCEHCDYVATHGHNLKKHIEAIHLGVTYSCELCPYEATQKQNLKRHLKLKHSIQHWNHIICFLYPRYSFIF